MKYLLPFLYLLLLLGGCDDTSTPQAVVSKWATALEHKNLDELMSTYSDDAEAILIGVDGSETVMSGYDEIEAMQRGRTENPDVQLDVAMSDADTVVDGDEATCSVIVVAGEAEVTNVLEMTRREGEWYIQRQTISLAP
jgi:ketosteroid isomerase-like protein